MENQGVSNGRAHTVLEITHLSTRSVSNNQVSLGTMYSGIKSCFFLFFFFNGTVRNKNGRGWIVDVVGPLETDGVSSEQVLEELV